jgi:carbon dioxide concentrating mechanism protein CcmL
VRIGEVIGKLTLNRCDPRLCGGRFMIVQPHTPKSLRERGRGTGDIEVVYDELGARLGDRIGFSEGREAAMPFHPTPVAVDAYLACLIDDVRVES